MEDWKKLLQLLDRFDAQYVAECVYTIVAQEFYNLAVVDDPNDQKFMDELVHFINN